MSLQRLSLAAMSLFLSIPAVCVAENPPPPPPPPDVLGYIILGLVVVVGILAIVWGAGRLSFWMLYAKMDKAPGYSRAMSNFLVLICVLAWLLLALSWGVYHTPFYPALEPFWIVWTVLLVIFVLVALFK